MEASHLELDAFLWFVMYHDLVSFRSPSVSVVAWFGNFLPLLPLRPSLLLHDCSSRRTDVVGTTLRPQPARTLLRKWHSEIIFDEGVFMEEA